MRYSRSLPLGFLFLLVSAPLIGQQAATTDTQATLLLQRAFAVLTGGTSISDVTLSGTARRIAGSEDESGSVTLKAIAGGAGRMDLSLPSGQRSEIQNWLSGSPAGSWSGPDGISHAISYHNLMTDPFWFFPVFSVARLLSSRDYALSYIGQETRNGQSVLHLVASQPFSNLPAGPAAQLQHLTQLDFFLDPSTYLPVALSFNTHPDNDVGLDIPIEIHFSDYRSISGAQIPFRVQKFLNNSLTLDMQFQTATLNSGLTTSSFSVQ